MPRRTRVIPAAPGFDPVYWNVAIYRPGTTSGAFHEDDDLWMRTDGVASDLEILVPGDRFVWMLSAEERQALRLSVAEGRWNELDVDLRTQTLEELVIVECLPEPRIARDGQTYGVLHVFVESALPSARSEDR